MNILLVYNQGNFKNLIEIENTLKSYNHNVYMPENSLIRNHKVNVSEMTDIEIRDYIRFVKQFIRELDCILVVNNDYNEDYKSYEIDSIARLKMNLAKHCMKPVFVLNEFERIYKSDMLPVCINNNLEEISLQYNNTKQTLKNRRYEMKKQVKQDNKEKVYK